MDKAERLTPNVLEKIIQKKRNSVALYDKLLLMAPDVEAMDIIKGIRDGEEAHMRDFYELYRQTGKQAVLPEPEALVFNTYEEGLGQGLLNTFLDYDLLRNIYIGNPKGAIGNLFLRSILDGGRHASGLSYLYSKGARGG